jgi:hypothetical protein
LAILQQQGSQRVAQEIFLGCRKFMGHPLMNMGHMGQTWLGTKTAWQWQQAPSSLTVVLSNQKNLR